MNVTYGDNDDDEVESSLSPVGIKLLAINPLEKQEVLIIIAGHPLVTPPPHSDFNFVPSIYTYLSPNGV